MKSISKKTKWVSTDGWRGREVFVNAIAGANDTGTWSDSPCQSSERKKEIDGFCSILRKAGIRFTKSWAKTSNVFCASQQVLVDPENAAKAYELACEHKARTNLFYPIQPSA